VKKKLYFVKYEVIATSVQRALKTKGRCYEIVESDKSLDEIKNIGFNEIKNVKNNKNKISKIA
jgi:hypothetical protein